MKNTHTVWRIVSIEVPGHHQLDVQLVMDTTAEVVVKQVEDAAAKHGIALERIEIDKPR